MVDCLPPWLCLNTNPHIHETVLFSNHVSGLCLKLPKHEILRWAIHGIANLQSHCGEYREGSKYAAFTRYEVEQDLIARRETCHGLTRDYFPDSSSVSGSKYSTLRLWASSSFDVKIERELL